MSDNIEEKQQAAIEKIYSASVTEKDLKEMNRAINGLAQTLPETAQENPEEIADILIQKIEELESTFEKPLAKKISRLLTALAEINTPNGAEIVANYASGKSGAEDDRIQVLALMSLSRMTEFDDMVGLLKELLASDNKNNRINALSLRLLIQSSEDDKATYTTQLLEMAQQADADVQWAVLRALRTNENQEPPPEDVERQFIEAVVGPALLDGFAWRDVKVQAALVLGDIRHRLRDAMARLDSAYRDSSNSTYRTHIVESILNLAKRMNKKERDASQFDTLMLAALADDNPDVVSRARNALVEVYKTQKTIDLIVVALVQNEACPPGYIEALRNIDDGKASEALNLNLFHPDPDVVQRATNALQDLGGEDAFNILYHQRKQTIDRYTELLRDADQKIMDQYKSLMRQAHWAFWISMCMHILIFLVGLFILGGTFYFVFKNDKLEWFWGLFGVAGGAIGVYLGLFYKNPVKNIGNSVTRLVKINVTFLGFMRQINQIDATFKQLFLGRAGFSLDEMKNTVEQIKEVVDQSLEKIQTYLTDNVASS